MSGLQPEQPALPGFDPREAEALLPAVYEQLRGLASHLLSQEKAGQTIQATALVHEAYLRLRSAKGDRRWDNTRHFFAAAAEAMRRILINRARDKGRQKRGGHFQRIELEQVEMAIDAPDDQLLALDEALQQLSEEDPTAANLVKLRFFAGMSGDAAAEVLGIAPRTADRLWAYARAWLYVRLSSDDRSAESDAREKGKRGGSG